MKNKSIKKAATFIVALAFCVTGALPAMATEHPPAVANAETATPRYVGVATVTAELSFSSKSATAKISIVPKLNYSYSAKITLQQKSGLSWSDVKSWTENGTSSCVFKESYTVSASGTYRVHVEVTVKDSGGKSVETITKDSPSSSC